MNHQLIICEPKNSRISDSIINLLSTIKADSIHLLVICENNVIYNIPFIENLTISGVKKSNNSFDFFDFELVKQNFTDESNFIYFEATKRCTQLASLLAEIFDTEIRMNVDSVSNEQYTVQIFSGKAKTTYSVLQDKPNILGIVSNFSSNFAISDFKEVQISNWVEIDNKPAQVKILDLQKSNSGISLKDAKVVVGAGRGMKAPENWGIIEDLAKKLNAGLACSKPVSDINWRPHHEHVGQTGIKISPKLYIACGISGAIQHLAGVNGSEIIVVINNDPEAPFHKNADYYITEDLFKVIPSLLNNLN
ncbi:electron transfer flavoprotein subunit alpha/FixB family protein [Sandaracinomonas limnophila]|uniref:Electron transfer flavoprotein subunit alpha/FixB family protein n=1 Tax=Sandaracinomonas limnophila TaxID=1862386 RepID=A0A437PWT7_9BACT|nr:electron transfer flavoprotein subunit alpha/FixB family protein [Sandaracinomonas limnophila]RVU26699.1 electron transfer flavoprotein subunit alpha/FixB family protein [Sandaracinomonas limnophila]